MTPVTYEEGERWTVDYLHSGHGYRTLLLHMPTGINAMGFSTSGYRGSLASSIEQLRLAGLAFSADEILEFVRQIPGTKL